MSVRTPERIASLAKNNVSRPPDLDGVVRSHSFLQGTVVLAQAIETEPVSFANIAELLTPNIPLSGTDLATYALDKTLAPKPSQGIVGRLQNKIKDTESSVTSLLSKIKEGVNYVSNYRKHRRRPKRPRCMHGKLKTEPCDKCSREVKSKLF